MSFDIAREALIAKKRISAFVFETPLSYSLQLSKQLGVNVYFKCENFQHTRSFKLRGAMNKLLMLSPAELRKGVVTASSGNHGAAVAYGLKKLKGEGAIFLPKTVAKVKIENIQQYEIPIIFNGNTVTESEVGAMEYANKNSCAFIPPYSDYSVIAGQATIGVEILSHLANADVILVPVGGGGLISGIAGYVKSVSNRIKVIGCLPALSANMYQSIQAGSIITTNIGETLSDGTAVNVKEKSVTFPLCKKYVDDFILVSEAEIKKALIMLLAKERMLVEGAAAVPLAGLIKCHHQFLGKNVVVVLSGGNISVDLLSVILGN